MLRAVIAVVNVFKLHLVKKWCSIYGFQRWISGNWLQIIQAYCPFFNPKNFWHQGELSTQAFKLGGEICLGQIVQPGVKKEVYTVISWVHSSESYLINKQCSSGQQCSVLLIDCCLGPGLWSNENLKQVAHQPSQCNISQRLKNETVINNITTMIGGIWELKYKSHGQ